MPIDPSALSANPLAQMPMPSVSSSMLRADPNAIMASAVVSNYAATTEPQPSAIVTLGSASASNAGLYNAQGQTDTPEAAQMSANTDPLAYWTNALPANSVNAATLRDLSRQETNRSLLDLTA